MLFFHFLCPGLSRVLSHMFYVHVFFLSRPLSLTHTSIDYRILQQFPSPRIIFDLSFGVQNHICCLISETAAVVVAVAVIWVSYIRLTDHKHVFVWRGKITTLQCNDYTIHSH